MNTEFQKMATVGMSVLVATGDNGVADEAPSNSTTCKPFNPDFPSSSPYVTAVSATQVRTVLPLLSLSLSLPPSLPLSVSYLSLPPVALTPHTHIHSSCHTALDPNIAHLQLQEY
eukprot:TRINITY_DN1240_c1_g5_i1.p1 TRINITY_DN1240_c1_g5~~TRINITY_DN1240_c1_g5_i1.p1  ORF type:complete len:115 (+),score=27.42 TRINITY_DN1240_c1_g5_i1:121-465(+)